MPCVGWQELFSETEHISDCYRISDHNVNPEIVFFTEKQNKTKPVSSFGMAYPLAYTFNPSGWNTDIQSGFLVHTFNPKQ